MIRLALAVGAGYVLGSKAGRKRYEQISKVTKTIATSPTTKKAIEVGRRKVSDTLNPDPKMKTLRHVDDSTTVFSPKNDLD